MTELSRQGFYDFVHSQPKGKTITHGRGWDQCAVGEYVDHILGESKGPEYDLRAFEWINKEQPPLPNRIVDIMRFSHVAWEQIPTYGKLSQFISEHE